ncbi:MAG TPA: carboxymuconolactone decarboxylase family protein [Salinibacter sp.]|nr:carboxymuconolactone decarboxylase family protein [Salinibacter sp.]
MTHAPSISDADASSEQRADTPRLAPIEAPSAWKTRLVYLLSRWQEGTVITPLKVVWARMPEGLRLAYEMDKHEAQLTLDPELRLLVKKLVSTINDCSFCEDIAAADAQDENVSPEKWNALLQYDDHPAFGDAEHAALAYAEEVTRETDATDATFDALRPHFDERQIVELTWLVAMENYYNLLNRPLGIGAVDLCEANAGVTR